MRSEYYDNRLITSYRKVLMRSLLSRGYHVREFLLSPSDFGIPNSRLRYFCLAKLHQSEQQQSGHRFYAEDGDSTSVAQEESRSTEETIQQPIIRTRIPGSRRLIPANKAVPSSISTSTSQCQPIKHYIDPSASEEELKVRDVQ